MHTYIPILHLRKQPQRGYTTGPRSQSKTRPQIQVLRLQTPGTALLCAAASGQVHLLSTRGQGQGKSRWFPSGRDLLWDDLLTLGQALPPLHLPWAVEIRHWATLPAHPRDAQRDTTGRGTSVALVLGVPVGSIPTISGLSGERASFKK